MQVIVFLVGVFFALTVFMAGYVYYKNPRQTANRLLVYFSAPIAVWCFGFIFMTSAPDEAAARLWFRVTASGWAFIPPLFLHFTLAFTENGFYKRHRRLSLLLYLPVPILTYSNVAAMPFVTGFVRDGLGWQYAYEGRSPWLAANAAFIMAYIAGALVLFLRLRLKTPSRLLKKQSAIIVATILASLGAFFAATYLPTLLGTTSLSCLDLGTMLIWQIGAAFAITRYGFMVISPESAAPSILRTMTDGLLLMDTRGKVIGSNRSLLEILEKPERSVVGGSVDAVLPKTFSDQKLLARILAGDPVRDVETAYTTAGGREVFLSLSASHVVDRYGEMIGAVALLRDVSERKRTEQQLQYLATHDSLTGLPNRLILEDRLRNALARAKRYGQTIGVVFVDVDSFKAVNDRFGHASGDLFLKAVADALRSGIRAYDTVARMGGDEFVVILADLGGREDCELVITRLRRRFSRPLAVGELEIRAGLSMGISLYPLHAENIEELYKFADIAMYRVKESGRDNYRFYSPGIAAAPPRGDLERELREAIDGDGFELHYQPICDTRSGAIISLEALIRWRHPRLGLMNPLDFIPLAEKSGLIVPLGEWVLRRACRQQKAWKDEGMSAIPVTVNISARQFQDPELVAKVGGALEEAGIEPRRLELELTESTAMEDVESTIRTVRRLKEMGVAIMIDDFGSGYSSLSWLKQLEVRAIKIDRLFIRNVATDPHDAAIVKAIVSMAHSLGIRVVAEGVENEGQLEALRSMRWDISTELVCDLVQGYLFSRPLPPEELAALFAARTS
ncbi:MAG: EAL domain-containing protein [Spirochaetales bacterium]|nr:EAL domain-containing protein [Spirochaetales bacterium]